MAPRSMVAGTVSTGGTTSDGFSCTSSRSVVQAVVAAIASMPAIMFNNFFIFEVF